MAKDNQSKHRKQCAQGRVETVEECHRESQTINQPETRLKHYGDDPKWLRKWSIVFRRMR